MSSYIRSRDKLLTLFGLCSPLSLPELKVSAQFMRTMSSRGRSRSVGTTGRGRGARSTTPGGRAPNPETLARMGMPVDGQEEAQRGE